MSFEIDSESNPMRHPKWKTGVRVGSTKADKVLSFIPPHQNGSFQGAAGEGVAVDSDGTFMRQKGRFPGRQPAAVSPSI
jgi:hypothetical protein